jgi:hypothetical protein
MGISKREFLRMGATLAADSLLPQNLSARGGRQPHVSPHKLVLLIFGGVRRAETFALGGFENIPHLANDLGPQSVFYMNIRTEGVHLAAGGRLGQARAHQPDAVRVLSQAIGCPAKRRVGGGEQQGAARYDRSKFGLRVRARVRRQPRLSQTALGGFRPDRAWRPEQGGKRFEPGSSYFPDHSRRPSMRIRTKPVRCRTWKTWQEALWTRRLCRTTRGWPQCATPSISKRHVFA